ncbi:MAG: aminodeoxychorismate/anthranilate synthase component II [Saprospiraceae bacterium]
MKLVLIDNYDSFSYILAQYLEDLTDVKVSVIRNDEYTESDLQAYDKIVISPGPGLPSENGIIIRTIKHYSGIKPILGVCLGLQAIYEAFGGQLINLKQVHHGVSSKVFVVDQGDTILTDIGNHFFAGRYHSWVCDPKNIPDELLVTAVDEENQIMACRHRHHPTFGVQFHPESILTPEGKKMIKNFLEI